MDKNYNEAFAVDEEFDLVATRVMDAGGEGQDLLSRGWQPIQAVGGISRGQRSRRAGTQAG